jgi:8-oxo-dGTP pyrophosphatase MutT (NUDIX family)
MLLRAAEPSGLKVYLTRRSAHSRFMPGAYVFPGGAVDAQDRGAPALARLRGAPAGLDPALARAALRELFEEAGVLVARRAHVDSHFPGAEALAKMRSESAAGADFTTLLAEADLVLDATQLVHYSNWITPESEPIRFDTHFFLARAPQGQEALADAGEVHDGRWLAPAEALAAAERGEMSVIFPTLKHLERLAAYDSVEALFAHARERTIVAVMPRVDAGNRIDFDGSDAW